MARDSSQTRPYPPLHPWLFRLTATVMWLLLRLLTHTHTEGLDRIPDSGRLIVVSNHLHYFDTAAVGATLPRPSYVLAAEKYEKHILFSPILRVAGAIFINRGEADRAALRQALAVLKDDHCLAIAIEGTRSQSGALAEGKQGTAYLATRAGAPIIPVVVWGTENIIPAWFHLRRAEVHVVYGEPFSLPAGRARAAELARYTEQIMIRLARLLPADYRGVYQDHPLIDGAEPSHIVSSG
jgi:1-acyl-sn-glycerol-3-phosphate acyltransferase